MLEIQEQQHRRVLRLSVVAMAIAAFATINICVQIVTSLRAGQLMSAPGTIYLFACVVLMMVTIGTIIIRSRRDFGKIRDSELVDQTTGLPSRASLSRMIAAEIHKLKQGDALGVILLDIRRFKSLNHSFGFQVGDAILRDVAARLRQIVTNKIVLARYDGDRFAFLQRGIASQDDIAELVSVIQRAMVPPFATSDKSIYIDLSIGSAMLTPLDQLQPKELLRRAEFALIEAKNGDSKQHVPYSDGSLADAKRQSTMETGLRETLETNAIEIHFQPIVDSRFDRIVAVEALARWTHPQYGKVAPEDFVGMAETLGLAAKMGLNILRRACQAIGPIGDLRLCVNISPLHFLAPGFVKDLTTILEETGFPGRRLELEITESVVLSSEQHAADVVDAVRALGVSIALDDFGTGYSGLAYLNRFKVDRIKIDASFTQNLKDSAASQSIIATIIGLARDRSLNVTVEGVENTDQVVHLSRFGELWYQGFLFSRPMPIEDLARLPEALLAPVADASQLRQILQPMAQAEAVQDAQPEQPSKAVAAIRQYREMQRNAVA
jgi:diguanylate cyclase (GGDEF)-like protein